MRPRSFSSEGVQETGHGVREEFSRRPVGVQSASSRRPVGVQSAQRLAHSGVRKSKAILFHLPRTSCSQTLRCRISPRSSACTVMMLAPDQTSPSPSPLLKRDVTGRSHSTVPPWLLQQHELRGFPSEPERTKWGFLLFSVQSAACSSPLLSSPPLLIPSPSQRAVSVLSPEPVPD
ncbi:hypothetical protein F2P81_001158 [Scophthalmus maximus]|uniref:Uncharacterized protein n=1 Tax=Scophthalmus maximus TaxID=52904 RepID=A0A6A4TQJ0_SCOMX|nr:hypothetical protein F2P81_001158 [Scophthalmus maximus]